MKSYTGTGTASRFVHGHLETRTMPLAVEAKDARGARAAAMRQLRDRYPTGDGYTHVVALAEEGEDE